MREFRSKRIQLLRQGEKACEKGTKRWGNSLSETQDKAQGDINFPLLARKFGNLRLGFPIQGEPRGAEIIPSRRKRNAPDLLPYQMRRNSKSKFDARMIAPKSQDGGDLWGEAMEQEAGGWLDGPFRF